MKKVLVTLVVILFLFLQLAQVGLLGDMKRMREKESRSADEARAEIEELRGYLDLVERYTKVSRDDTQSAVAAILYAHEINKDRTPEAAIDYYTKLLPEVRDPAARRAIRFELVELYLRGPKPDAGKALEQLREVIVANPGNPGEAGAGERGGAATAPSSDH